MKKILYLMLFMSVNGHATDLINLYERAKQHNIDILNNQIDVSIANESLKQTRSSVFPEINFNARASETTIERYKSLGSYDPSNYDRDTYNLSIKQPLLHLYVFDEIKKAKSSLEQNEITKDNADSSLILESVRHYFNLIKFKNAVALSEIENEYQRSRYRVSSKLYENGSISVEEYETLKNNYESSKNDLNISKNNLSQIKNDVYVFSGKELNDINDIKLLTIRFVTVVHQKCKLQTASFMLFMFQLTFCITFFQKCCSCFSGGHIFAKRLQAISINFFAFLTPKWPL